jgi:ATP-binding cassette, subfamily B, bacterial PglK
MQVNSNIFMVIIIIIGMIIYDAKLTFTIITLIGVVYFLLNTKVGSLLLNNGRIISLVSKERFKIITNGLGSVRDIIMSDSSNYFNLKMKKTSQNLTYATTINQVIAQVPGRVFQALILGSLVLVILYHSSRYDNIDSFVISLTAFIMAGYKLMPMFQSIYESISSIKSNFPAIEAILSDFSVNNKNITFKKNSKKDVVISGDIQINNLSYTYQGNKTPTVNHINVIFKKGTKIGIMGESGSGKSTLINLIISLIYPTKGELMIGGKTVNRNNAS